MPLYIPNRRRHHSGIADPTVIPDLFAWFDPRQNVYENAAGTDPCEDGDDLYHWASAFGSKYADDPNGGGYAKWRENGGESYVEAYHYNNPTSQSSQLITPSSDKAAWSWLYDDTSTPFTVFITSYNSFDEVGTAGGIQAGVLHPPPHWGITFSTQSGTDEVTPIMQIFEGTGFPTSYQRANFSSDNAHGPWEDLWHVTTWRGDDAATQGFSARVDGVNDGTYTELLAPIAYASMTTTYGFSCYSTYPFGPSGDGSIRVGDIIVYDRELTDDECRSVEEWIAGRYGVTLG